MLVAVDLQRRRPHPLLCLLAGSSLLLLALAPRVALAKRAHCRDVTFDGAAGVGSQDLVKIAVVDTTGAILDQSCVIQVRASETHTDFGRRLPGAWGSGDGSTGCPGDDSGTILKSCGSGATTRSCTHQFIFKANPKDPVHPKKELLRICCFETVTCKSPKLGSSDVTRMPVTVQASVNSSSFAPQVPPGSQITVVPVAIDPIGMRQLPTPPPQPGPPCRQSLAEAVKLLVKATDLAIVGCHADVMAGNLPAGIDCDATPASDPTVAAAKAALRTAGTTVCAATAPPASFGFASCPSPCPGPIGDWTQAADCIACLTEAAATGTMTLTYGTPPPGPGLPSDVQKCQNRLGAALSSLMNTYVGDTSKCQKLIDSGSLTLPEDALFCKDADVSGTRQRAEDATIAAADQCLDSTGLDGCADDPACIIDNATFGSCNIADAVFPEGRAEDCILF